MTNPEPWKPTPRGEVRVDPKAGTAVDRVLEHWYQFRSSSKPVDQADALVSLSNAMFDLSTWHPDYDERTGELREEKF